MGFSKFIIVTHLLLWFAVAIRAGTATGNYVTNDEPATQLLAKRYRKVSEGIERAVCKENYRPCDCYKELPSKTYVICTEVTVKNVQNIFSRTNDTDIYYFEFEPFYSPDNVITLPENFFADKRISNISIITYSLDEEGAKRKLIIDPLAFNSSQNHTIYLELYDWDLSSQTDFTFLEGFDSLVSLILPYNSNMQAFQYLPPLPSLSELSIKQWQTLSESVFPDLTPARLKSLSIVDCFLGDLADDVLSAVIASTSRDSFINLAKNAMTAIPKHIPVAFPNLNNLDLSENSISHIPSSSLVFSSPVFSLDLSGNHHDKLTIDSGAFQGNFTMATVDLFMNKLTLFEEGVFKEMLQQIMSAQPRQGYLWLVSNPFVCGCDLAWLICGNPELLPAIPESRCASDSQYESARFQDLNPEDFVYCFQTTTYDPTTPDFTNGIPTSDQTTSFNTPNNTQYPSTFHSSTQFGRTTSYSPTASDLTTIDPVTQSTGGTSSSTTTRTPDTNASPTINRNTHQLSFVVFLLVLSISITFSQPC